MSRGRRRVDPPTNSKSKAEVYFGGNDELVIGSSETHERVGVSERLQDTLNEMRSCSSEGIPPEADEFESSRKQLR
ncbi:unnamed protein product [Heligmosomoides polygyrus]|uniref:Uncharacterized protein n=1 Tax=Heligmosomoides polygyrus TaxID=6339 RepID=A0A183FXR5_HELPZ|nr:unnamed protein product [Heligmosomoides polygyrus]